MTLALHLNPQIARDFSIMIQSVGSFPPFRLEDDLPGSTAACVCVFFMNVRVEHRAIVLGTLGCVPGFIIGVHFVSSFPFILFALPD